MHTIQYLMESFFVPKITMENYLWKVELKTVSLLNISQLLTKSMFIFIYQLQKYLRKTEITSGPDFFFRHLIIIIKINFRFF